MDINGIKQSKEIDHAWKKYLETTGSKNQLKNEPIDDGDCPESTQTWANINNSNLGFTGLKWAQTAGFNYYYLPDLCAPLSTYCDKYPVGCGPVAIGMIMKYYQKPINFTFNGTLRAINYNIMPVEIFSSTVNCFSPTINQEETAALLKFVAGKYAQMWCFTAPFYAYSATALYPWLIRDTFSACGYTYPGNKIDYFSNIDRLTDNLKLRKPVIFSGSSCDVCLWNAHIWLCEGLVEYHDELCSTYSWVFMNWGWAGTDNGWFGISNSYTFNGIDYNNSDMKIVVDIKP